MSRNTFKVLMLHGRPASGKSETIDYLKKTPIEERIEKFHIGEFIDIDDFPMLWAWFEEDAILESMGQERLHTTPEGFFKYEYMWNLLVRRLCLEYDKINKEYPEGEEPTVIIEFSRGSQHGGYASSYENMDKHVLRDAAIYYVKVDFDESIRKNQKRKNPDKLHSLLEHSVEDDKLKVLYRECDFDDFIAGDSDFVEVQGIKVPYAVLNNQNDLTTNPGEKFEAELKRVLDKLWNNYKTLHKD